MQKEVSNRTEVIEHAEEIVKAHMAQYDPSHDWAHANRVRNTALAIARTMDPNPDMLVVELAALFHDMADAKYNPTSSLQTLLSPFLTHPTTLQTLSPSQTDLIVQIIPNISWSTESKLRARDGWTEWHETCPELHAVQDADRLDAMGAIGIMRCAAYSAVRGIKLLEAGKGESEFTAESHFEEKLLLIRGRMKTAKGREEAEKRHETMVDFLGRLEEEQIIALSPVQ